MPRRVLRSAVAPADVQTALATVRAELEVPAGFPPDVLAEAERATREPPAHAAERADRREIPFVTIDPPGARDLDQAVHVARRSSGFRVSYAIADVAAFVVPAGAVDAEAHRRGVTLDAPDGPTLLHPAALAHAGASLLPDADRPAVLWTVDLDEAGEVATADVRRALVRSRAQLTYAQVQADLDVGRAAEPMALLREVGLLREDLERDRGGVALSLPEQEVVERGGGYALELRRAVRVEDWNAQVSLLTGIVAARMQLDAGVGLLRTLPDPAPGAVAQLRRTAAALDVPWADGSSWAEFLRGLDPGVPVHAALLTRSTQLLRGAGYEPVPAQEGGSGEGVGLGHAAVAAPYAHVTAPLRRLVDRYASEVCVAASAGREVPGWVREALPALPVEMAAADRRAGAYERACVDLVEAWTLAGRVGEVLPGVVVDVSADGLRGVVQTSDPDVVAGLDGVDLPLGERVRVRVVRADVAARTVRFELA